MIIVQPETTKDPISLIGREAGVCWGGELAPDKDYKRGLNCLKSGHGRTFEFPQVYLTITEYSARAIRELYTHIGGGPTRLQASTRYIDYGLFDYIIPATISEDEDKLKIYNDVMKKITDGYSNLQLLGVPKEDIANILPLGMKTTVVMRTNLRNLIDMMHQRKCSRAYWEMRLMMKDICVALSEYSEEWAKIVDEYFVPKCSVLGYCPEEKGCGKVSKK